MQSHSHLQSGTNQAQLYAFELGGGSQSAQREQTQEEHAKHLTERAQVGAEPVNILVMLGRCNSSSIHSILPFEFPTSIQLKHVDA